MRSEFEGTEAAPPSTSSHQRVRVVVIEPEERIRSRVAEVFNHATGCRCTGAFSNLEQALPALRRLHPDVMFVDARVHCRSCSELLTAIFDRLGGVQVVVLAPLRDSERAFELVRGGARGCLLDDTAAPALVEAAREVRRGGTPLSPEFARALIASLQRRQPSLRRRPTPQEMQLLSLLAAGSRYEDVARRLGVTVNTVRTHVRNLYAKLEVHNKAEAVSLGLRSGLIA